MSVDGAEGATYDEIPPDTLVFSPDGKRAAYTVPLENKQFVVADGAEGKRYDGIADGMTVWSGDGRRLAYAAKIGADWIVVADGRESPRYSSILSALVFESTTTVRFLGQLGNRVYLTRLALK